MESDDEAIKFAVKACEQSLAAMMLRQSLATGHGDDFEDLLRELEWQIAELRRVGEKRNPTGLWPDWGDSPKGFDGPTGAE